MVQEGDIDPEELLRRMRGKPNAFEVLRTACQLGQTEIVARIVADPNFLLTEVTWTPRP